MATERLAVHESWSSQTGFLLAAVGGAVGLGNVWRFPYVVGEYGGGAFVLVYLGCVAAVMLPMLMGEFMVGRRGRQSPVRTIAIVAEEEGRSPRWRWLGWMFIGMNFVGLGFYSVVAGWTLDYAVRALTGGFAGYDAETSGQAFAAHLGDPVTMTFWYAVVMGVTVWVVTRGVRAGLERAVRVMVPALALLLLVLVGYAMTTGQFGRAVAFMFTPDFSKLTAPVVLIAMGQAFFSIGAGFGPMITYGAYMPRGVSIPRAAFTVCAADTAIALLAGLAIFPIVFAYGLSPAEGPGLLFATLPVAFGQMPGGPVVGAAFFLLLALAALTSTIGMLEVMVSRLVETRGLGRRRAALAAGAAAWLLGMVALLSFNVWADVRPLPMFEMMADKNIFGILEYSLINVAVPVGGILIAVFAGWMVSGATARAELGMKDGPAFALWRGFCRYLVPAAVAAVLLANLG